MANGLLGSVDLAATTNTTVYQVPASPTSLVAATSVNFCNRNSTGVRVRLAICDTTTPGADEYFEYERSIGPYESFERTGLPTQAGKYYVAYASAANVSAQVYGFEE